jgi:hypothetical protein
MHRHSHRNRQLQLRRHMEPSAVSPVATPALGTISTSGLYTAPAAVPATNPVTITATSTANTAKSGSYTITITAATATITAVTGRLRSHIRPDQRNLAMHGHRDRNRQL